MEHQRYDRRRQARIRARRRRQIRRRLMMAGIFFLLVALGVSVICVRAYRKAQSDRERENVISALAQTYEKFTESVYGEEAEDGREFAEWTVENCSAREYGKL